MTIKNLPGLTTKNRIFIAKQQTLFIAKQQTLFIAKQQTLFITGGHLTPALAVIDELKKNNWEIYFLGRKFSLEGERTISIEYKVIRGLEIPFLALTSGRLQRRFTAYTLISLLKIPLGLIQSGYYLLKYKPQAVLSFGGYLSLPVALVSFLTGVPIITHEQTVHAGLANRIIGLLAKKICLSYPSSKKFFPGQKTVLTGNPLRKEIWEQKKPSWFKEKERNYPLLYITGGSLGSQPLNELITKIINSLLNNYYVIHQTGESQGNLYFQKAIAKRISLAKNLKERYFIRTYIEGDEIGWVLNQADLLISRAGANTVAEIMALKKAAILIPLPYALEQRENAQMAASLGLARVLDQEGLTGKELLFQINDFFKKIKEKKKKAKEIENLKEKGETSALLIVKEVYGAIRRT